MATYNTGREAKVGDAVRLDGRTGTVTAADTTSGNEAWVELVIRVAARTVTPVGAAPNERGSL